MKPLFVNPYIVGNPIKSRQMFFGREDDFQFVARKIGEGRSNQVIVFCGDRRSGKTSILFQILGGQLGPAFLPILVDMQMLAGLRGDLEFFQAIFRSGWNVLREAGVPEPAGAQSPSGGAEGLMETFLREVRSQLPGKVVLFLFDEYELIESKIHDGTLSESTIHYLAGILESPYPASFVLTGSTNLEDRDPAIWRTLLGKSVYRKISYLSRRDAERLVTEPLKGTVTYSGGLVESIWRLTGGQPFYTQVVCQNLTDLLIDEQRTDPSEADLERIVKEIVANPLPQMIYSWNSFPPHQQLVLSVLAGRLTTSQDRADGHQVYQHMGASHLKCPFDRDQEKVLLEQLYHQEFLDKDDHGSYRFRMDLFRRWIQREHSIWKVASDAGLRFRRTPRLLLPGVAPGIVLAGLAVWLGVPAWSPLGPGVQTVRYVGNVQFMANRGPFTLVIDNMNTFRTSDSPLGITRYLVPSLAMGPHDFIATSADGVTVSRLGELVDESHNSFVFYFAPKETGAPPGSGVPQAPLRSATGVELATLEIISDPPGATVLLENDIKGVTPIQLPLSPGYHPIWLAREGYYSASLSLTVEGGKAYRREVVLEKGFTMLTFALAGKHTLYLDGAFLVTLPTARTVAVPSGHHQLKIVDADGGVHQLRELNLIPGEVSVVRDGE